MRIALIGTTNTGKTTFRKMLAGEVTDNWYIATIGWHTVQYGDHEIWEHGGGVKMGGLLEDWLRQCDAALIFYCGADRHSENQKQYWIHLWRRCCPGRPCKLVASKSDIHPPIHNDIAWNRTMAPGELLDVLMPEQVKPVEDP